MLPIDGNFEIRTLANYKTVELSDGVQVLWQQFPYEEGESRHVRDFECDFDLRHFASSVVLTSTFPAMSRYSYR